MTQQDYTAILQQMTLEEKVSLCSGLTFWKTKPIERLGVPSVQMNDGPNGLRKEKESAGTNVMKPAETATCFPTSATVASSWDTALMEEIGAAIADEARAMQVTTVLGPGVNIKRSPLCGRNFEYFSEDPLQAAHMGAAWVKGVQENGVGVSLKHYCANNQEYLRMCIDTIVDERALREIYLYAFEHIVKTQQPKTVMCSYNRLAGTYLSDNKRMLTDVLRGEWGFENIVVSDWGAVNDRVAGIRAGMDLEMPGNNGMNDKNILKAIAAGELSEAELDVVVLRMLRFAFACKANEEPQARPIDFEAHHRIARKAAANSAVLLKNDGQALPLKKEQNIAVIGALAKKLRYQGSGSSHVNPPKTVSFVEAMQNEKHAFAYADAYTLKGDGLDEALLREACETAKGKDAVLVFIGLTDAFESEGFDRTHANLPQSHYRLMQELAKVNSNLIVVLSGGSPAILSPFTGQAKAILNLYLGGQAGGEAAYDVIFGAVNPSGKLAETYACDNADDLAAPYFGMGPRTVEHRESVFVGYRYYDTVQKPVLYPFGHGLSYTTFAYSDLSLSATSINEGEPLSVSCKIKNTGAVAGAEVVQLYVSAQQSRIFRPAKELKGFQKIFLQPGEEKNVTFTLDARAFSFYNVAVQDWYVESGAYTVALGASSRDVRLSGSVQLASQTPDAPIPDYRQTAPVYYALTAETKAVPAEQFAALYGAPLQENTPFTKGTLTINNSVQQLTCSGFGRFLCGLLVFGSKIVAIGTENPDMITKSVKDMPLRSFSGFTGGLVSQMSVNGILDLCNGVKGGTRKLFAGFRKKNR